MDDLHHGAHAYRAAPVMRKKLGSQQQQRRTETLSATHPQVLSDVSDCAHTRHCVATELTLDRGKVVTQQVKNFFGGGCGR